MKQYNVAMPYFYDEDISWIQEKVGEVLRGQLSMGPYVKEFEEKFAVAIGAKYAVFVNTCTTALEISVRNFNIQKEDEVIVPVETFIASGMAVTLNGGKVVFAEIDPETFNISLAEIKKRKTDKTKGVMLVHFAGNMSPDTLAIQKYCQDNGLFLIEDCAHAVGSSIDGKKAGTIGNTGCFSFFSTKILATGEGGMLTTNSQEIYNFALALRDRGRSMDNPAEIFAYSWRSGRVTEITALLGLSQLSHLDQWLELRNKIAREYNTAFEDSEDLNTIKDPENVFNAYWKHITVINNKKINRLELAKILKQEYGVNINWAYGPPLHLQPVYREMYGIEEGYLPITEEVMTRHFHLPMQVTLTVADAKFIASSVLKVIEKLKRK